MYKLLVVEDDLQLRQKLKDFLKRWGYEVYTVEDFSKVQEVFSTCKPHLVLMDINLPQYNGFHWCSMIRKVSKCPILFISSRDEDMDIIMAMNSGGDDYITKPFSVDVLGAKVSALLRRTYAYQDNDIEVYALGKGLYNPKNHSIAINDQSYDLTKNESRILLTLLNNRGEIVKRDTIMDALWNDNEFVNDNTLTKNINRLRKKLEEMGMEDLIQTKKGEGYILS